jgi:hypothetical protein
MTDQHRRVCIAARLPPSPTIRRVVTLVRI